MHYQTIAEPLASQDGFSQCLADCLHRRLGNQLRDFRVTIQSDGLILQGRVRTYYGKQVAQHVVMEVSDLAIFANETEVI